MFVKQIQIESLGNSSYIVGSEEAKVCAAGVRASTAAGVLEREGFGDIVLMQGGMAAWENAGYPLDKVDS